MSNILNQLDSWGCDVTGAMSRCFGDTEFYLRWVKEFAVDPGFESLDHELNQKNFSEAFRTAHGLKGDAGMLGLTPLLLRICTIVEDLRNGPSPTLNANYKEMKKAYEKFVDIIDSDKSSAVL